jgi:hypothetical protein
MVVVLKNAVLNCVLLLVCHVTVLLSLKADASLVPQMTPISVAISIN